MVDYVYYRAGPWRILKMTYRIVDLKLVCAPTRKSASHTRHLLEHRDRLYLRFCRKTRGYLSYSIVSNFYPREIDFYTLGGCPLVEPAKSWFGREFSSLGMTSHYIFNLWYPAHTVFSTSNPLRKHSSNGEYRISDDHSDWFPWWHPTARVHLALIPDDWKHKWRDKTRFRKRGKWWKGSTSNGRE